MLPMFKPHKAVGVIVAKYKDGETTPLHEEGEQEPGLVMAMEDFLRAKEAKDPHAMAEAFKAAFEICESYPHEENSEMEE